MAKVLQRLVLTSHEDPSHFVDVRELLLEIWPTKGADPQNVYTAIRDLRTHLAQFTDVPCIETIDRRYRLLLPVTIKPDSEEWTVLEQLVFGRPVPARPKNSPLPGPSHYNGNELVPFCGREAETARLLDHLGSSERRLILLDSPSGAGKSSLLRTKLRSHLIARKFLVPPIVRIGNILIESLHPNQNPLTAAVIRGIGHPLPGGPVTLKDHLGADPLLATQPAVIIVDQGEEIVTNAFGPPLWKWDFFRQIEAALIAFPRLHILIAFRQEFLSPMQRLIRNQPGSGEKLSLESLTARESLDMLPVADAVMAIYWSFRTFGIEIEEDLVSALAAGLSLQAYVDSNNVVCFEEGDTVEPLQLQLVCSAIWNMLGPDQAKLECAHVAAYLGVDDQSVHRKELCGKFIEGASREFCQEAVNAASRSLDEDVVFPAELIDLGCLQFLTERKTRKAVLRGSDYTGDLPNPVVDQLVRHHILRLEEIGSEQYVELAHDSLIPNITERAAMVDNDAIWTAYMEAIRRVAESAGLDPAIIEQECSFTFVGDHGGRLVVPCEAFDDGTSRLPFEIVKDLTHTGMIRWNLEKPPGTLQLQHPRLAQIIYARRSPIHGQLYRTRTAFREAIQGSCSAGNPADWYKEFDHLVNDVTNSIGVDNLTEREAVFVLRTALASGTLDPGVIAAGVGRKYEKAASTVLEAAVHAEDPFIRRAAANALTAFGTSGRNGWLLELATTDKVEMVRGAAARSLAILGKSQALNDLFELSSGTNLKHYVLRALARVHESIDPEFLAHFDSEIRRLPLRRRLSYALTLAGVRFVDSGWLRILTIWLVAMAVTVAITAPPRALLAFAGMTFTQANSGLTGFFEGAFQGIVGAVVWSSFIGGALIVWRFIVEGRRPWRALPWTLFGACFGALGGLGISGSILAIYSKPTLRNMEWLTIADAPLQDAFTRTGFAWPMVWLGAAVGCGVGLSAVRLLPKWSETMRPRDRYPSLPREIIAVARQAASLVSREGGWLYASMIAGAASLAGLLHLTPAYKAMPLSRIIGDTVDVSFGGVSLLIGLLLGWHMLRIGINVPGYKEPATPKP